MREGTWESLLQEGGRIEQKGTGAGTGSSRNDAGQPSGTGPESRQETGDAKRKRSEDTGADRAIAPENKTPTK